MLAYASSDLYIMLKILASGIIGLHCPYNFEVLFFVLLK